MSPPHDACFVFPLRVYWEDTDAGGIVFYANYLKFFERARTEWLRAAGFGQQALAESTGALFVVTDSRLRYLKPARLDDELRVTVQPLRIAGASLRVAQQAWCGEALLVEGEIGAACVDKGTFRPRRIPTDLLARLTA
ncbi:tol-pal system-associated acyl-CoA thioesterase [Ideonella sp.]|uniref:tol-pal system-associated acyl-CoA thioesterase n=1 Tax=Ideonella sp. TaxID=1929293 RepID=UPI0035ADC25E